MTMIDAARSTALDLLLPREDRRDAIADALRRARVQDDVRTAEGTLATRILTAFGDEVSEAIERLTDVKVGDLIVAGIKKHVALSSTARRTLEAPGSEELVKLAKIKLTSEHEPAIDVMWQGDPIATLDFELTLVFTIEAATCLVRAGKVVALYAGSCEATAELKCNGIKMLATEKEVNLAVAIRFADGIPILSKDASAGIPARHE